MLPKTERDYEDEQGLSKVTGADRACDAAG